MKLMKEKDPYKYTSKSKMQFTAKMFTEDYQVHVDAHSASPVFVDDHVQLAMALAKMGAIGPDSLLEMTKPPRMEILKQRLKEKEAKKEQQQKAMLAAGIEPGGKKGGLKAV